MLATETKEQQEIRLQEESEYFKLIERQQKELRDFELTKLRLESSVPKRWEGIAKIFKYIFVMPIWTICVTILLAKGIKVPDFLIDTKSK